MSDVLAGRGDGDEHAAGEVLVDDEFVVEVGIVDVGGDGFDEYLSSAVVFAVDHVLLVNGVFANLILSSIAIVGIVGDSASGNIEGDAVGAGRFNVADHVVGGDILVVVVIHGEAEWTSVVTELFVGLSSPFNTSRRHS